MPIGLASDADLKIYFGVMSRSATLLHDSKRCVYKSLIEQRNYGKF
ncbi:hypothetical protein MCP1_880001 [Candidatus Terasakiella magnetica]|nr:hypothetical protein MCP1_880001 [Candidatus Terasakiella magnetica]